MNRIRTIRSGEALAIDPAALRQGREAFFALWSDPNPINERVGANSDVAVVHVRGPLDHHRDGGGDCYDSIKERWAAALSGEDCDDEEKDSPPKAVILCLDSPGGVVSGLNETVKALRKMSADAGIPTLAYLNEMAASAAYALACSCDEVYLPPSGIAGSIGVISMMVDQTVADEAMGLRFVTLTSGARKSDGHPHVAISADAIGAEQRRVNKLAKQFYALVQEARGLSPDVIASYQAGIFLGKEAVKAGLADGVMSWDSVVSALSATSSLGPTTAVNGGRANSLVRPPVVNREEKASMIKLAALIQQTQAALVSETNLDKRVALSTQLAAFQSTLAALSPSAKTTHVIEHKEKKTSDDPPPDADDSDSDSEEDEESEESAEGNETDRSDKPEDDEDDSDDEDSDGDDSEEEDEEEEEEEAEAAASKALRSALKTVKGEAGQKARGAFAAISAKAKKFDKMGARLAQLEKDTKARAKAALIDEALAKRRITPGEAKQLRTKSTAMVKGFLEMRPKAIVHSTQEDLTIPRGGVGPSGALSAEVMDVITKAHLASDGKVSVEKLVEDFRASMRNGAGSAGEY